jgi:hypothetical protein
MFRNYLEAGSRRWESEQRLISGAPPLWSGLAAHLSDPDLHARYDALDGLKNITSRMKRLVRCLAIGKNKMLNRKYPAARFGGSESASFEIGRKIRLQGINRKLYALSCWQ